MALRRLVKLPGLIVLLIIPLWGFLPATAAFHSEVLSHSVNTLEATSIEMRLPPGCIVQDDSSEMTIPIPIEASVISNSYGILAYQVTASMAQLGAFQEEHLPDYGWHSNAAQIVEPAQTTLRYTKEDHTANLTISQLDQNAVKMTIMIRGSDSSL